MINKMVDTPFTLEAKSAMRKYTHAGWEELKLIYFAHMAYSIILYEKKLYTATSEKILIRI